MTAENYELVLGAVTCILIFLCGWSWDDLTVDGFWDKGMDHTSSSTIGRTMAVIFICMLGYIIFLTGKSWIPSLVAAAIIRSLLAFAWHSRHEDGAADQLPGGLLVIGSLITMLIIFLSSFLSDLY